MVKKSTLQKYLDRSVIGALLGFALLAPISIAASQTMWALALLFALIGSLLRKQGKGYLPIDAAIFGFLAFTIFSSFASYEPAVSIKKLIAVSLVSIVYLARGYLLSEKVRRYAAFLLITGASVASLYSVGKIALGTGVKLERLEAASPLLNAGLQEKDTVVEVAGKRVSTPRDIVEAIQRSETEIVSVRIYRLEFYYDRSLKRSEIGPVTSPEAALGIVDWNRGRDVRASGFYGHYTTFAEVVQLVLSLCVGLLITTWKRSGRNLRWLLAAAAVAMAGGLALTITRGSWAGFALSVFVIATAGIGRRAAVILILFAIPVAAVGTYYLQQKRNVGMVDTSDNSTTWRFTVWREAVGVVTSSPRHMAVGVGMDSVKTQWPRWGMFDHGNLPIGHMHSDPIAIAFERGIPALVFWLIWMFAYFKLLWRSVRDPDLDPVDSGIALGCLGGAAGFLLSGIAHYNWGDSEVIAVFFLLMGIAIAIYRSAGERALIHAEPS